MIDRPERLEIAELIDAVVDGRADADQTARLDELIDSDTAARRYYVEHMELLTQIEHSTFESADAPADMAAEAKDDTPSPAPRQRNWVFRHPQAASITAAALITVAALVATSNIFVSPQKPEPGKNVADSPESRDPEFVAKLSNWHNDEWAEGTRPLRKDPRLKIGERLVLESGLVEVTYLTGARVVIEGPAEFWVGGSEPAVGLTMTDAGVGSSHDPANRGYLKHGRLVARVEGKKAEGFTVDTPTASVEDLGTEFSLTVHRHGKTDVLVHDGKVSLMVTGNEATGASRVVQHLVAGENARVDLSGSVARGVADIHPARFHRRSISLWHPEELNRSRAAYVIRSQLKQNEQLLAHDAAWKGDDLENWITGQFEGAVCLRNSNDGDNIIWRQNDEEFSFDIPDSTSKLVFDFDGRTGGNKAFMEVGLSSGPRMLFAAGVHFGGSEAYHLHRPGGRVSGGQSTTDAVRNFRIEIDTLANEGDGSAVLYVDNEQTVMVADMNLRNGPPLASLDSIYVRTNSRYVGPSDLRITAYYDEETDTPVRAASLPNSSDSSSVSSP